jgi:serine acetyltransferase
MLQKFFYNHTNIKTGGRDLPNLSLWFMSLISGYNHDKYWRRRSVVIDKNNKTPLLIKMYYLIWIKRVDAKLHCSFGTSINYGAQFLPPRLPHGPSGIIVGHDAVIGKDVVIYQQVTIAGGGVVIGDNVMLGAGAKVLPRVNIGNSCKVGANAVVVEDMA